MKIMTGDRYKYQIEKCQNHKIMFTEYNNMLVQLELNKGKIKPSFLNVFDMKVCPCNES